MTSPHLKHSSRGTGLWCSPCAGSSCAIRTTSTMLFRPPSSCLFAKQGLSGGTTCSVTGSTGSPTGWQCARSQAARRMGRFGPQGLIEKLASSEDLDGSTCASAKLMASEPRPWLHHEVSHLPEKYRTPIVLCYFEGLTHDEAADRMGCPLGTVKGRLSAPATCCVGACSAGVWRFPHQRSHRTLRQPMPRLPCPPRWNWQQLVPR